MSTSQSVPAVTGCVKLTTKVNIITKLYQHHDIARKLNFTTKTKAKGGQDDLNVCLAEGPQTIMLVLSVLGHEIIGP